MMETRRREKTVPRIGEASMKHRPEKIAAPVQRSGHRRLVGAMGDPRLTAADAHPSNGLGLM